MNKDGGRNRFHEQEKGPQGLLWSRVPPGGLTSLPPRRTEDQGHHRNIKLYSDHDNLVDQ